MHSLLPGSVFYYKILNYSGIKMRSMVNSHSGDLCFFQILVEVWHMKHLFVRKCSVLRFI